MPTYTYFCSACRQTWDEIHKIDNRKDPEAQPCPKCKSFNTVEQIIITAPLISYSMEATSQLKKLKNSKFAEKLNQIHRETPGSNLDSTSSFVEVKNG